MSTAPLLLSDVLLRSDIWRGDRLAELDKECAPTGFSPLDAELPGTGWPRGALIELLSAARGIGEVSLLLPALRDCCAEDAPVALIAPPSSAHAPAWAAQFPLTRLLIVEAAKDDIGWCAEHLLACGALGAVLAWLPANISNKSLRRLHLAAEGSRSLAFMFRPLSCMQSASPAPLRLSLSGSKQGLQVNIFKRRGPPCEKTLLLQVERPLPWARVRTEPPKMIRRERTLELVAK